MVYVAPLAVLLALWLPGCNDGWLHTDSHYYAAMGLQAWRTHELLELRLGDVPFFNKPPLALLIHGWFLDVFGVKMWVARLPSLLAAMGATVGLIKLVSLLGTRRLALVAGLVLVTTVEFTRYTRAVSLDLWLACAMVWGLVAVAWAWRDERPRRLLLMGLAVGLGLLIKPVVAFFVVPAAALWLWMTGRRGAAWAWGLVGAAGVAAAVAAPWFIAMAVRHPHDFAQTFFVRQSLERLGWQTDRHWWYYLQIALGTYLPWIVPLVGAAVLWARRRGAGDLRPLLLLSWMWSLSWLALISAAGDKHGRYAVPTYLLLCVPVAWWLSEVLPGAVRKVRRAALRGLAPVAVACGAAAAMGGVFGVVYQRPRNAVWDELATGWAGSPKAAIRCTPQANKMASHLVLLGLPWPRIADEATPGEPGDVLLLLNREAVSADASGERVAAGDGVVAIRLTQRWPAPTARASDVEVK